MRLKDNIAVGQNNCSAGVIFGLDRNLTRFLWPVANNFRVGAADVDYQNFHAIGLHECPSRLSNSSAALGPQVPAA